MSFKILINGLLADARDCCDTAQFDCTAAEVTRICLEPKTPSMARTKLLTDPIAADERGVDSLRRMENEIAFAAERLLRQVTEIREDLSDRENDRENDRDLD